MCDDKRTTANKEVWASMKNKVLFLTLLAAIVSTSCTSPSATVTTVPSQLPVVSTQTAIPTNAYNARLTQTGEAPLTELVKPYLSSAVQDFSPLKRTLGENIIETLWFTESTKWWSPLDKQVAQKILKLGMNPGLGVRALHAEGITGKGVTVAIIDQPVILDHPEFRGKIIKYFDVGTGEGADKGSLHGPAVTSLLVGENIGTAPDAQVYYVAAPSWLDDAQYYADALDWIIAENAKLPEGNKIRVVSVSTMPSGLWALLHKNNEAWDAAYRRATDAGLLVLDCTYEQGITVPCTLDLNDRDNVANCIPEWRGPINPPHERINVPTSRRSSATELVDGQSVFSYQYTGWGGLSWSVPYLAGVLAMGWQINPELTNAQILDMLFDSAYVTDQHMKVIDPGSFIEMVRLTVKE
jgi:hypothetical protein